MNQPNRKQIRLNGYDYSSAGMYFVTVCAYEKWHYFGQIVDGKMNLNDFGLVAEKCWCEIGVHFQHAEIDEYVIMPNHMHGIVVIGDGREAHGRGTACRAPTTACFGKPVPGSLSTIIRSYKSAVTKRINEIRKTPGVPIWQRNFHDHIIRDGADLRRVREYIENNPAEWEGDKYYG